MNRIIMAVWTLARKMQESQQRYRAKRTKTVVGHGSAMGIRPTVVCSLGGQCGEMRNAGEYVAGL